MGKLVTNPDHGAPLTRDGRATDALQLFIDDITEKINSALLGPQVQLTPYTVLTLPSASTAGGLIFVTDEAGGAVPAFSDGANFRRVTDRAIVS